MAYQNQHQTPKTNTQPRAHAVGDVVYTEHGRGTVAGFENLHLSGITETDQPDAESYRVIVDLETPHSVLERTRLYYSVGEVHARPPFDLPDSGKVATPLSELHYWGWLRDTGKTNVHRIETKREYLTGLGFVVGEDWLRPQDITILRYAEEDFFIRVIRARADDKRQGGDV